jgi:hypothetical protein
MWFIERDEQLNEMAEDNAATGKRALGVWLN